MRLSENGKRGAPTVLAVDDNASGLMAIESVLHGEGYEIHTAESGLQALESARTHLPDVVLLDVMMPGMDGFEVCRRIRSDPQLSQVPVVMVTALDDRTSRIQGIEAGADDFLTKPLDRQELRARVRNITDLNRYRQLNAERAKLERLIALSPDGLVVLDPRGRILHSNAAFESLTGGSPEGREDGTIWELLDEGCVEAARAFHASVQGEEEGQRQIELVLGHGEHARAVEIAAGPSPWEGRSAVQWMVRDVTERKKMEEQLQRVQRFEDIAHLTASIAHDFRNYLSAIVSSSDLLLMDDGLEPESREDLETIRRSALKAADVCKQLLAFSGQRGGDPKVVDLQTIIREIRSILDHLASKAFELEVQLGPDPLPVLIDRGLMEQVVVNLVVNARDAMDGPGTIRVATGLESGAGDGEEGPQHRVVLSVRDEGVGMDDETVQRIFDPYFTTKDSGTGLGLSTVHGIVKRADGEIQVLSREGEGTDFRILLPLAEAGERSEGTSA